MASVSNGMDQHAQEEQLKMRALGKVYIDHGGDLSAISRSIGVKFKDHARVRDGKDFA